jgi:hypothetical protein
MGTPCSRSLVAAVCLKSWKRRPPKPASRRARLQAVRQWTIGRSGSPVLTRRKDKMLGLLSGKRTAHTSRVARAGWVSGTGLPLPASVLRPSPGRRKVESCGYGIENKRVTGKTLMRFRGPKALLDIIKGRPFCSAVLVEFAQNRAIPLTTKSKTHTKLRRQPRFWASAAVGCVTEEQVKRAVVSFDHFENPGPVLGRVFSGPAHAVHRQNYAATR